MELAQAIANKKAKKGYVAVVKSVNPLKIEMMSINDVIFFDGKNMEDFRNEVALATDLDIANMNIKILNKQIKLLTKATELLKSEIETIKQEVFKG